MAVAIPMPADAQSAVFDCFEAEEPGVYDVYLASAEAPTASLN